MILNIFSRWIIKRLIQKNPGSKGTPFGNLSESPENMRFFAAARRTKILGFWTRKFVSGAEITLKYCAPGVRTERFHAILSFTVGQAVENLGLGEH